MNLRDRFDKLTHDLRMLEAEYISAMVKIEREEESYRWHIGSLEAKVEKLEAELAEAKH